MISSPSTTDLCRSTNSPALAPSSPTSKASSARQAPAVLARQFRQQPELERPCPAPRFHADESPRSAAHQGLERLLPAARINAVTCGHHLVFCPCAPMIDGGRFRSRTRSQARSSAAGSRLPGPAVGCHHLARDVHDRASGRHHPYGPCAGPLAQKPCLACALPFNSCSNSQPSSRPTSRSRAVASEAVGKTPCGTHLRPPHGTLEHAGRLRPHAAQWQCSCGPDGGSRAESLLVLAGEQ